MLGFVYPDNSSFNIGNVRYSSIKLELVLDRTIRVTA